MYAEKLSIIIPTRNRQKYAEACVRSIFSLGLESFQVVVQDNSDDDSLREALKDIISERLVYNYIKGDLSFCDNFSKGLEKADGDYVIYIGDDDGILPEIFDIVDFARKNNIEAIRYYEDVTYKWPGAIKKDDSGELVVRCTRPYLKTMSTENAIASMIKSGDYNYQKYNFPLIYHGIVRREAFDKVREKTGHYFGGLTPDIYAAVALSFCIRKILYINYPLSIPGVCPRSGSADSLTGRHNGDIKQAPHFRGTHDYHWDQRVPYVYSVDTIWAETAFTAMSENDYHPELTQKDYYQYLITLVSNNPAAKAEYFDYYIKKYGGNDAKLSRQIALSTKIRSIKRQYKRGINYLKTLLSGRYVHNDVQDIQKAIELTEKHLTEKGLFSKTKEMLKGLDK